jgi:hypothetical protein
VRSDHLYITNSRGLIWVDDADEGAGNFRNGEQAAYGYHGRPMFNSKHLPTVIGEVTPSVLVGAVGVCPGCFDQEVIGAMMTANCEHDDGAGIAATSQHSTARSCIATGQGGLLLSVCPPTWRQAAASLDWADVGRRAC